MTKSEYQALVEFLGRKFDGVDERFSGLEDRMTGLEDRMTGLEDRMTRVEVLCEENRHQIQIVAEGVMALRAEMVEGFRSQGELIKGLGVRVSRLEARVA